MKQIFTCLIIIVISHIATAQSGDSIPRSSGNSADRLMSSDSKLTLGGYGEVHYNQPVHAGEKDNGSLDVHRLVMLLGYNFNSNLQFISEIEFEHVSEVFVEQAFLQYKFKSYLNFRAGLMLIPMGIINEYHEPPTFNGVERPLIDTRIAPTTWREIGAGISGNFLRTSLKYQIYLINGFNGYDGVARLNGKDGFRNSRQKGAESYISAPNIAARVDFYGIKGLTMGLSGYFGKTQSTLYQGIDKNDQAALTRADSSVTGIAMAGWDARYNRGGLHVRGQVYYAALSNTGQYNQFTSEDGVSNDLGSAMFGYYLEAGYNILKFYDGIKAELILFGRLEHYDTHFATTGGLEKNNQYRISSITGGLTFKPTKGTAVKADIQFLKSEADQEFSVLINAGIGFMF